MIDLRSVPKALSPITAAIVAAGGRPVLVGGWVRDRLLGLDSKDMDIEVYGLELERLMDALGTIGKVHAVGKCFGVLKLRIGDGEIDISLPRREKKVSAGHRGFQVDYDPNMPYAEAASRRDFTINAIGLDLTCGDILDPWGGVRDIERKTIRHISDAFDEDPLRVLRACQFAARFDFSIAPKTLQKCQRLQQELTTLSTERIWEEFKKLLLKAPRPSVGIVALEQTGALSLFPELAALRGVPQNPLYHPEGEVWVHNNLVLDACADICKAEGLDDNEALIVTLAALCHDFGKPATTRLVDGVWRSIGHEEAGEAPTRGFLQRIGCPASWVDGIVALVREHTRPLRLWDQNQKDKVSVGAIRRLALRVPIRRLCLVSLADYRGRTSPEAALPCAAVDWLQAQAKNLHVHEAAPKPLLFGRDLQPLGLKPGPAMGQLLKAAFEAQLDGAFADRDGGLEWIRRRLSDGDAAPSAQPSADAGPKNHC